MDAEKLRKLEALCEVAGPDNFITNDECFLWLEKLVLALPELIEDSRKLAAKERECNVLRTTLVTLVRAMKSQGSMDPVVVQAMHLLARLDLETMEKQLLIDALTQPIDGGKDAWL
jgi:hypothetical protein